MTDAVIVTGGASGIGAATCAVLEEAGFQPVAADLTAGDDVRHLDVTDETSWASLFDDVGPVCGLEN